MGDFDDFTDFTSASNDDFGDFEATPSFPPLAAGAAPAAADFSSSMTSSSVSFVADPAALGSPEQGFSDNGVVMVEEGGGTNGSGGDQLDDFVSVDTKGTSSGSDFGVKDDDYFGDFNSNRPFQPQDLPEPGQSDQFTDAFGESIQTGESGDTEPKLPPAEADGEAAGAGETTAAIPVEPPSETIPEPVAASVMEEKQPVTTVTEESQPISNQPEEEEEPKGFLPPNESPAPTTGFDDFGDFGDFGTSPQFPIDAQHGETPPPPLPQEPGDAALEVSEQKDVPSVEPTLEESAPPGFGVDEVDESGHVNASLEVHPGDLTQNVSTFITEEPEFAAADDGFGDFSTTENTQVGDFGGFEAPQVPPSDHECFEQPAVPQVDDIPAPQPNLEVPFEQAPTQELGIPEQVDAPHNVSQGEFQDQGPQFEAASEGDFHEQAPGPLDVVPEVPQHTEEFGETTQAPPVPDDGFSGFSEPNFEQNQDWGTFAEPPPVPDESQPMEFGFAPPPDNVAGEPYPAEDPTPVPADVGEFQAGGDDFGDFGGFESTTVPEPIFQAVETAQDFSSFNQPPPVDAPQEPAEFGGFGGSVPSNWQTQEQPTDEFFPAPTPHVTGDEATKEPVDEFGQFGGFNEVPNDFASSQPPASEISAQDGEFNDFGGFDAAPLANSAPSGTPADTEGDFGNFGEFGDVGGFTSSPGGQQAPSDDFGSFDNSTPQNDGDFEDFGGFADFGSAASAGVVAPAATQPTADGFGNFDDFGDFGPSTFEADSGFGNFDAPAPAPAPAPASNFPPVSGPMFRTESLKLTTTELRSAIASVLEPLFNDGAQIPDNVDLNGKLEGMLNQSAAWTVYAQTQMQSFSWNTTQIEASLMGMFGVKRAEEKEKHKGVSAVHTSLATPSPPPLSMSASPVSLKAQDSPVENKSYLIDTGFGEVEVAPSREPFSAFEFPFTSDFQFVGETSTPPPAAVSLQPATNTVASVFGSDFDFLGFDVTPVSAAPATLQPQSSQPAFSFSAALSTGSSGLDDDFFSSFESTPAPTPAPVATPTPAGGLPAASLVLSPAPWANNPMIFGLKLSDTAKQVVCILPDLGFIRSATFEPPKGLSAASSLANQPDLFSFD